MNLQVIFLNQNGFILGHKWAQIGPMGRGPGPEPWASIFLENSMGRSISREVDLEEYRSCEFVCSFSQLRAEKLVWPNPISCQIADEKMSLRANMSENMARRPFEFF